MIAHAQPNFLNYVSNDLGIKAWNEFIPPIIQVQLKLDSEVADSHRDH